MRLIRENIRGFDETEREFIVDSRVLIKYVWGELLYIHVCMYDVKLDCSPRC